MEYSRPILCTWRPPICVLNSGVCVPPEPNGAWQRRCPCFAQSAKDGLPRKTLPVMLSEGARPSRNTPALVDPLSDSREFLPTTYRFSTRHLFAIVILSAADRFASAKRPAKSKDLALFAPQERHLAL